MTTLIIIPTKSVNDIEFGVSRAAVEASFGQPAKTFKKTKWSKSTTADYGDFHVYYDTDGAFEAVEIFDAEVDLPSGMLSIPANEDAVRKTIQSLKADEYGLTSTTESVGASLENGMIIAILFGKTGYYA
jgi:hypothetical protein